MLLFIRTIDCNCNFSPVRALLTDTAFKLTTPILTTMIWNVNQAVQLHRGRRQVTGSNNF